MGEAIDPNGDVPEWDLVSRKKDQAKEVNPFSIPKQGKRVAEESPEDQRKKKHSNVDDWQVAEFLHAYLEGTQVAPKYGDLDWEKESESQMNGGTEVESSDDEEDEEDATED